MDEALPVYLQSAVVIMVMKISYKKIWHLLIEKYMRKIDLRDQRGIATSTVHTGSLVKTSLSACIV